MQINRVLEDVVERRQRIKPNPQDDNALNQSIVSRNRLAKPSVAHRKTIDLVDRHERSVEEAVQITGLPRNTVKSRKFHARPEPAKPLKDSGVDWDGLTTNGRFPYRRQTASLALH